MVHSDRPQIYLSSTTATVNACQGRMLLQNAILQGSHDTILQGQQRKGCQGTQDR